MGTVRRLTEQFAVFIPSGRSVNPVTNSSWEGTGVVPDVVAPAQKAREIACVLALRKRIGAVPDGRVKDELSRALAEAIGAQQAADKVDGR